MTCKICGRQSCTESFHSITEQEDIDKIQSDRAIDLLAENKQLKQQRDDLLEACKNALVSLAIISMPRLDNNVATDAELLKIMGDSFRAAIAKATPSK